jgi:hypothetical protein
LPLPTIQGQQTKYIYHLHYGLSVTPTNYFNYPPLPPKLEKLPFKSSTGEFGQTIKYSNPERDLTCTASDVGTLKQWNNLFYANACTDINRSGFAWVI